MRVGLQCRIQVGVHKKSQRRVMHGLGQYGTVWRCIGLDWMGWDGPNEAGVATFQASTGQTRAPHSGQPICVDLGLFGVRTGH